MVKPRVLNLKYLKKKFSREETLLSSRKYQFFYLGFRIAKIFNKKTLRKFLELLISFRFSLILGKILKKNVEGIKNEQRMLKEHDLFFFKIFLEKLKAVERFKEKKI
mmetsp:Transcript_1102/g.2413  ORF Transcript_1102/g.2413 Transcript_1102/m.2413 type:complete len:107 (+) Transcript_1102:190-510(+)